MDVIEIGLEDVMKKYLFLCTALLGLLLGNYHYGYLLRNFRSMSIDEDIKQVSRVTDDYFEVYFDNEWKKVF